MNPLIKEKIPEINQFLRHHKVQRAFLFGSATSDKFSPGSDIDLLILFEEGLNRSEYASHFWSIYLELPKLIGHPVDLVTEEILKNPFFIEELNETKICLYDKKSEEIFV